MIWSDDSGEPTYLGVKTGWFSDKLHVLPAHAARVDSRRERVWVPFSVQAVKDAPAFCKDFDLSDADETRVEEYYRQFGSQPASGERRSATQTSRESDIYVPLRRGGSVVTSQERNVPGTPSKL